MGKIAIFWGNSEIVLLSNCEIVVKHCSDYVRLCVLGFSDYVRLCVLVFSDYVRLCEIVWDCVRLCVLVLSSAPSFHHKHNLIHHLKSAPTPSEISPHTIWNQPHTIASIPEANKPPNRLKAHTTHSDCVFIFSSFHDFRV